MTTNHLILDFSHVYCDEKIPKNDRVHWLDCSDIANVIYIVLNVQKKRSERGLNRMESAEFIFWILEIITM